MIHREYAKRTPRVPKAIAFGGTEVRDGETVRLDAGEQEICQLITPVEGCALPSPAEVCFKH